MAFIRPSNLDHNDDGRELPSDDHASDTSTSVDEASEGKNTTGKASRFRFKPIGISRVSDESYESDAENESATDGEDVESNRDSETSTPFVGVRGGGKRFVRHPARPEKPSGNDGRNLSDDGGNTESSVVRHHGNTAPNTISNAEQDLSEPFDKGLKPSRKTVERSENGDDGAGNDDEKDTSLVSSLLDDLLSDDDSEEISSSSTPVSSSATRSYDGDDGKSSDSGTSSPFLGYDSTGRMIDKSDDDKTDHDPFEDSSTNLLDELMEDDEDSSGHDSPQDREPLLERLRETQKDLPEYPVEAARQANSLHEDVSRKRTEERLAEEEIGSRIIAASSSKKQNQKREKMTSPFRRNDAKIVQTSENGREDAVRGVAPKRGTKRRYRYARPSGKLNKAELDFFKNIETSQNRAIEGDPITVSKLRRLQGRKDGQPETRAERKAKSLIYAQAVGGRDALRRGAKPRFTWKDKEVLTFLAMFRYATDSHLARILSQASSTMRQRLYKLRQQGLVKNMSVYGTTPIWYLTEAGMILSGYDVPRATEARMSFSMFPHQFTVNYVASNLWGANVNVLMDEEGFPERNRINAKGERTFGETLVSEIEILSGLGRAKNFEKGDVFSPAIRAEIERQFQAWENNGGVSSGPSPEMQYGNEYMWALFPPYNMRLAYHVPDLVVRRPRTKDGKPRSLAIEVEINNKPSRAYEKTLRAYKQDSRIFEKVIWICKNLGPARKLEEIAKEIGLYQEDRIKIVPILTEDGVFRGRDLWTI